MSLKRDFQIRRIPYAEAMAAVVEHHYLHRKCPCSEAFGLFNRAGAMVGVICYGTPSSSPLRSGVCGPENAKNVLELTRLWIDDSVPKNGESFLIGNTVNKVTKEIIVSYADTAESHLGVVYQATNWIYTGLSAKRSNWTIAGVSSHCQTLADKYSASEIREIYGDKFSLQPRSRKHRYVFFNCNKYRRRELSQLLRYPVLPYPKVLLTKPLLP